MMCAIVGQKAPSAKRCIKTARSRSRRDDGSRRVRKRRAPKGALRLSPAPTTRKEQLCLVRKRRAPKGALRQVTPGKSDVLTSAGQKAPSAKRCIKTHHQFPFNDERMFQSESTERQKVHQDQDRRRTLASRRAASDSTERQKVH